MSTTCRFCPSPTGLIHLGNMRTALFNALYAIHAEGSFLLRIEDTDRERSDEKYTAQLMADLRWLGLQWQQGPEVEGSHGPYWQSKRQAIYDQYYQQLIDAKLAYHCFCSEEQLAITRKVQLGQGQPPRYPGTCRHLSADEVEAKLAQGLKPTLRLAMPKGETIEFIDHVKGKQQFACDDMGDFIIRRTNGTAPFMYCNAIDDALMGVTHVLRGEDHLTNTPRQILLLQYLQLPIPSYGHMPLIVGPDGSPLSKRHGSRSVKDLREAGFLPQALNNYLARLGHHIDNNTLYDNQALAAEFSLDRIGTSPARFDIEHLHFWQKEAVQALSDDAITAWLGEALLSQVDASKRALFVDTVKANIVFPKDAEQWRDIFFVALPELSSEDKDVINAAGTDFFAVAAAAVKETNANYQAVCQALKDKLQVKGKKLFQPLRLAITGQLHGPEMEKIFALLGEKALVERLQQAVVQAG